MNRSLVSFLLASTLLAGCGGESISTAVEPLAGLYRVDLGRTTAVRGAALQANAARAQAVLQQRLGPDSYLLDLRPNATFVLSMDGGNGKFVVQGTWVRNTDGDLILTTTAADGQPASPEESLPFRVEADGTLVYEAEGKPIYLVRS
jgi:hypothetical protein